MSASSSGRLATADGTGRGAPSPEPRPVTANLRRGLDFVKPDSPAASLRRPAFFVILTAGSMAVLPILRYPSARLRQTSEEVRSIDDSIRALVTDMADTMYAANGAGLAAIQVGVPLRLFIVEPAVAGKPETDPPVVFINPE